ncbi:MAG: WbqC family protein [Dehalococcoidia bacterium]|nr:WbqC family protein [Dehalococcoidia bacterium]MDD5493145.1 WbqC family protein [Dehalococcoidia bacterium]
MVDKKQVVVLQPGYLPWLGFFDQMYKSDIFVIYDDVQFDKHGWRNRNRIKTAQGIQWLTVPVLTKGRDKPLINEVLINNNSDWRKAHFSSIKQNYSRTPFFSTYINVFEEIYSQEWEYLIDLDVTFIRVLMDKLNLNREILFSSKLEVPEHKTHRLINICVKLGATDYLTGKAAEDYIDESLFNEKNIRLQYHNYTHPSYSQMYGDFIPFLSVVDLLFNHGPQSLEILINK